MIYTCFGDFEIMMTMMTMMMVFMITEETRNDYNYSVFAGISIYS